MLSIILIIIWAMTIFYGIYGIVKGHFYREQEKAGKQHEPNAYHRWVRLSSVFMLICGVLNVIWSILDGFSDASDWKYIIFIIITVVITIAAAAIAYRFIVKPADEKARIGRKQKH